MPHLLITTQVYPPETHPTAVMVEELARFLVQTGWQVTVVAGYPNHPGGRLYPGTEKHVWTSEMVEGVRVLRSWHLTLGDASIPLRAAGFVSQVLGSALAGSLAREVDAVLVYGPPLVGPVMAGCVAARHRAPLATVIYDLYPDIAIETGAVTNRVVIGVSRVLERLQYLLSRRIIVLSDGFRRTMVEGKRLHPRQVAVIPVWLDESEIVPGDRLNGWRSENGIAAEARVVLYAGTIGRVSGADVVLDAAERLREEKDILFLFVGEGTEKERLSRRAAAQSLANVRFLPFQPRKRLPEVQATADLALVTLAPGRGRTSVPSKVLGYMAAGRPVLAAVDADSDTAVQVTASEAGWVCTPGDGLALANAVREVLRESGELARRGCAGRAAFEATYSRSAVLRRYLGVLEDMVAA